MSPEALAHPTDPKFSSFKHFWGVLKVHNPVNRAPCKSLVGSWPRAGTRQVPELCILGVLELLNLWVFLFVDFVIPPSFYRERSTKLLQGALLIGLCTFMTPPNFSKLGILTQYPSILTIPINPDTFLCTVEVGCED